MTTQTLRKRPLSISPRRDSGIAPRPGSSWRKELGIGEAELVIVPDHVLTEQAHRINLQPVDVTSAVCGDPLPGESALDRLPAPAIAPAQERAMAYNPRKFARIQRMRSPREVRRERAMAHNQGE